MRRAALAADPPPPELEGSARAAFGLSRLDEELATLLHDSEQESVAVRGDGDEPHLLSFGSDDVGTDLEITATADGARRHRHRARPGAQGHGADAGRRARRDTDEHGRFRTGGVTGAAVRVRMETESGVTVVTPWVRLG